MTPATHFTGPAAARAYALRERVVAVLKREGMCSVHQMNLYTGRQCYRPLHDLLALGLVEFVVVEGKRALQWRLVARASRLPDGVASGEEEGT